MEDAKIITTGVDRLVQLVRQKKRISVEDAARSLSVPKVLVEEWAGFLEEKEVVGIEYKLTTPYLVYKTITKKEAGALYKELADRKEGFVRKVDSAFKRLELESQSFVKFKKEFGRLIKDVDTKLQHAKVELNLVRKYDEMKRAIDTQIVAEERIFDDKRRLFEEEIQSKKRIINQYLKLIDTKLTEITREETLTKLLKKSEEDLEHQLTSIVNRTKAVDQQIKEDRTLVSDTSKRINKLKEFIEQAKDDLEGRKEMLTPLINESKKHQQKVEDLKQKFFAKVLLPAKSQVLQSQELKNVLAQLQAMFSKKLEAERIVNKLDVDISELKKNFKDLSQQAIVMKFRSKFTKPADYLRSFEVKLSRLNDKKESFRKDVNALLNIFKKH